MLAARCLASHVNWRRKGGGLLVRMYRCGGLRRAGAQSQTNGAPVQGGRVGVAPKGEKEGYGRPQASVTAARPCRETKPGSLKVFAEAAWVALLWGNSRSTQGRWIVKRGMMRDVVRGILIAGLLLGGLATAGVSNGAAADSGTQSETFSPAETGGDLLQFSSAGHVLGFSDVGSISPWPMFQHDAQHTGRSPYVGPQTDNVKWTYDFPEYPNRVYDSRVVVGPQDIIYVGRYEGVYSIEPNGTLRWILELPDVEAMSIDTNGIIYAVSRKGLSAIDQDGNKLWQYMLPSLCRDSEPVVFNDKLYLVTWCIFPNDSMHLSLFSFCTDGTVSWIYDLVDGVLYENPDFLAAPPGWPQDRSGSVTNGVDVVIGHDGTIHCVDRFHHSDTLYAFNPDGSLKWTRTIEPGIGKPSIDIDGTILFSAYLSCYAITPDAEDVWICSRSARAHQPSIGLNGTSYWKRSYGTGWGCSRCFLFALDNQGKLAWEVTLGESNGRLSYSTALGADGIIYSAYEGTLMAFDQDGGEVWRRNVGFYFSEVDLALGSDGTLYAASGKGVYAFGADTTPPTVSSVSPENSAPGVAIDTAITATFSEAMDGSTINGTSFTLAGSAVSGTVSYDSGTYTATFTPDANLDYDHTYTATISTAVTDAAGNSLDGDKDGTSEGSPTDDYSWSISTESASGRTWHVDDDLADYPTADFTKIQEAVDAASPGDTIVVYPGTYTENIDVNRDHLTIKSENGAEATIVQAANSNDHVFEVTADYANIGGFTIEGATESEKAGIYLDHANHSEISNNTVLSNSYGIYSNDSSLGVSSSNNEIVQNTVSNNGVGIRLCHSSDNTIYLNNFMDNIENTYSNDSTSNNIWHSTDEITYTYNGNTYTSYLGNYWDDYAGSDVEASSVLQNGGFEEGDFSHWQASGDWEVSTIRAHTGTYSAHIYTGASGGTTRLSYTFDYPIPVSDIQSFTWWYYREGGDNNCVGITYSDGSYEQDFIWGAVSDQWTQRDSTVIRGLESMCSYEPHVVSCHPGGDNEKAIGSPGLQDSR